MSRDSCRVYLPLVKGMQGLVLTSRNDMFVESADERNEVQTQCNIFNASCLTLDFHVVANYYAVYNRISFFDIWTKNIYIYSSEIHF
jgi:hypothetical protein